MEDFVPFEIAKKLKEKGYPQEEKSTIAMYDEDGCLSHLCPTFNIDRCYYIFDDFDERDCVAPTISQVLKWLREEKKIHIEVVFGCCGFCWDLILNIKYVEGHDNSEWDLLDCEKYAEIDNQENHSTYEECALCAIEYVLNNII